MKKVKIALPTGDMKIPIIKLFSDAFLPIIQQNEKSFDGQIRLPEFEADIRFMKSTSIADEVVEKYDAGISGQDLLYEAGLEKGVEILATLPLGRRSDKPIQIALVGKPNADPNIGETRLYTDREYSRLAREEAKLQTNCTICLQNGASEEKIRCQNDFAIVATETGDSLRANGLVIYKILMESQMVFFVRTSLTDENYILYRSLQCVGGLLAGVANARQYVLVTMNVLKDLENILKILPARKSPTITNLQNGGYAVSAVVPRIHLAEIVISCQWFGASDILVQELNMVVN